MSRTHLVKKRSSKSSAKAAKQAFGRPGTAGKGTGDAAFRQWLSGVDPKHRPVVEKLDALIAKTVPGVKRAIKWSMPMYGVEGQGWFANVAPFKEYVRLGFFLGTQLKPQPPVGEGKTMRQVNLRGPEDYDEAKFRAWIKQASSMKGWGKA